MSHQLKLKWLNELNKDKDNPIQLSEDGQSFWCKACEKRIDAVKKYDLQQHLKTGKHTKNSTIKRSSSQSQLEALGPRPKKGKADIVGEELCKAFLAANIPWSKMIIQY